MHQTFHLSHADAQEMIDLVRRRLEADRKAGAIAVTDSHGELIAFLKMDGCRLPPIQIAMNKAFTAAREGKPSADIGKASMSRPFPMTNFGDLRYTGFTGGAPVIVNGQVAGAIGISGIDDESEALLSAYAVDAISKKAPR
jgi:glc operon protein GlcG